MRTETSRPSPLQGLDGLIHFRAFQYPQSLFARQLPLVAKSESNTKACARLLVMGTAAFQSEVAFLIRQRENP